MLNDAREGDVLIKNYKNIDGLEYSVFKLNDTTVQNIPYDGENILEVTYRALIDLSMLSGRYKTLLGINGINHRV